MYPKLFKNSYINPNSLKAIEVVYTYLYKRYGNVFKALKHYKGAVTNFKTVYKTIKLRKMIDEILKS